MKKRLMLTLLATAGILSAQATVESVEYRDFAATAKNSGIMFSDKAALVMYLTTKGEVIDGAGRTLIDENGKLVCSRQDLMATLKKAMAVITRDHGARIWTTASLLQIHPTGEVTFGYALLIDATGKMWCSPDYFSRAIRWAVHPVGDPPLSK